MKLILKFSILLIIVFAFCLGLNLISLSPYRIGNTISEFNSLIEDEKNIDIAIYGSSHAFCSYNPLEIDRITKGRSFNFGSDAQRLPTTKYVVQETLKKIKPQLLVIDIYPDTFKYPENEKIFDFQKRCFYFFDFTLNKVKSTLDIFPIVNTTDAFFPFMRRKQFIPSIKLNQDIEDVYQPNRNIDYFRGYVGFSTTMKPTAIYNEEVHFSEKSLSKLQEDYNQISKKELQNLLDIISYAKSENIKVLLTISPYYRALGHKKYASFHNYIKNIAKNHSINVLDFNLKWSELDLNYLDFKDGSHLNAKGAKKISTYLGEFIKESYVIPNRENDKEWLLVHESFKSVIIREFEKNKIIVYKDLLPDIKIKAINTFSKNQKRYLAIELNENLEDSKINNFTIGIHVTPFDKKQLSDRAKAKKRNFEILALMMDIQYVDGRKFIIHELTDPIQGQSKANIFLYNKEKYQGAIGKIIVVKNIPFKQN